MNDGDRPLADQSPIQAVPPEPPPRPSRVWLWAGSAIAVLLLIVAFFALRHNFRSGPDVATQLASARSLIEQKQYDSAIDLLRQLTAADPANTEAQTLLSDAQRQKEIAGLLDQARDMTNQNRLEEARSIYDRLLQLDPANSQAAALKTELDSKMAPLPAAVTDQPSELQSSLAEVQILIAANRLADAQARLDKVLAVNPKIQRLWLCAGTFWAGPRPLAGKR